MGLAPGVRLGKTTFKIPRIGIPFELMAAQIQQSQMLKDEFENVVSKVPKGNPLLPGTEELSSKLNNYFNKVSEKVADAFASGDGYKATSMLKAAKSQVEREFKQGGAAYALLKTNKDLATTLKEYKDREVDNNKYTSAHKQYDYDMWLNNLKEKGFSYNMETGDVTSIPTMQKTAAFDISKKWQETAAALQKSPDSENFISELKQASNMLGSGILVKENIETIKSDRIKTALTSLMSDPRVIQELQVRQYGKNKSLNRIDDKDQMVTDAEGYLDAQIEDYKKNINKFNSYSVSEKKQVLQATGDYKSEDTSNDSNDEFLNAQEKFLNSINSKIATIEKDKKSLYEEDGVNTANKVLLLNEAYAEAAQEFQSYFGIKKTSAFLPQHLSGNTKLNEFKDKSIRTITSTVESIDRVEVNTSKTNEDLANIELIKGEAIGNFLSLSNDLLDGTNQELNAAFKGVIRTEQFKENEQELRNEYISSTLDKASNWYSALQVYEYNKDSGATNEEIAATMAEKYKISTQAASELVSILEKNSDDIRNNVIELSNLEKTKSSIVDLEIATNKQVLDQYSNEEGEDFKYSRVKYKNNVLTIGGNVINLSNKDEAIDLLDEIITIKQGILNGASAKELINKSVYKDKLDILYSQVTLPPKKSRNAPLSLQEIEQQNKPLITKEEFINKLVDNMTIDQDITIDSIPTVYPVTKGGNSGLESLYVNSLNVINNGSFKDVSTGNTTVFRDYISGNDINIGNLKLDEVKNYSVGVGVQGKMYMEFNVADVNDKNRKLRIEIPASDRAAYTQAMVESGLITYQDSKDFGELTDMFKMAAKIGGYMPQLAIGKQIAESVRGVKNSRMLENKGDIIIYNNNADSIGKYELKNAATLVTLDNFVKVDATADGMQRTIGEASIVMEKTNSGNYRYRILFTNETGTYNLAPLRQEAAGFGYSDSEYFTDYNTAMEHLLVYKNMEMLQYQQGDVNVLDVLEMQQ